MRGYIQKVQTTELPDFVMEAGGKISDPSDVAELVREMIGDDLEVKEYFIEITLSAAGKMLNARIISIGTLDSSIVHPRDVFRPAILDNAKAVILAHNHPSGGLEPSTPDIRITDRMVKGGKLLGIEVLDHVIVTKEGYTQIPV